MFSLRKLIKGPMSPEEAAQKIVQRISRSAFRVFRDPDIRKLLNFSEISRTEQDRIFNELVVTGLSLVILMVETVSDLAQKLEKATFYRGLKEELPIQYLQFLEKIGIEKQYVNIWNKLIKMRWEEYCQNAKRFQKYLPKPREANPWLSVVAIGGLHHLRRGKTSEKDPLFKELLAWLPHLACEIEKFLIRAV